MKKSFANILRQLRPANATQPRSIVKEGDLFVAYNQFGKPAAYFSHEFAHNAPHYLKLLEEVMQPPPCVKAPEPENPRIKLESPKIPLAVWPSGVGETVIRKIYILARDVGEYMDWCRRNTTGGRDAAGRPVDAIYVNAPSQIENVCWGKNCRLLRLMGWRRTYDMKTQAEFDRIKLAERAAAFEGLRS